MPLFAQTSLWIHQVTPGNLTEAFLIIVVTMLLTRLVKGSLERLGEVAPRSRFFFKLLIPVLGFFLWLLAAGAISQIFAPSSEAMVALTASLGIALGFGSQDLVKNLIGGVIILTDRPYQLGDRVQIGEASGEIDHIGLRSTKMTTLDDTRITIPNSEVMTGKIWNSNSGVPDEQVAVDLFVSHHADPHEVLQIGYEAAYSSPFLLLSKPVLCLVSDQLDERPYLRLRIKGYVFDHRAESRFQSDITARAKRALLERGLLPKMQS